MKDQSPIEKYAESHAFKIAANIDDKMTIVIKPKPRWCPKWLYRAVIRDSVEIVSIHPHL
jgi:hypothetical protein